MKTGNLKDLAKLTKKRRSRFTRSPKEDRTYKGVVYASKAEKQRARELNMLRETGAVLWWIRQPVFDLAGVTYTADFLAVWNDGQPPPWETLRVVVEEVKPAGLRGAFRAEALRRFRRNQKQVKALYDIDVQLLEIKC